MSLLTIELIFAVAKQRENKQPSTFGNIAGVFPVEIFDCDTLQIADIPFAIRLSRCNARPQIQERDAKQRIGFNAGFHTPVSPIRNSRKSQRGFRLIATAY
jgi:hypothetical protein